MATRLDVLLFSQATIFNQNCRKYESCKNAEGHVHHPRNCLYYLRYESLENLQKLLTDNEVEFDTKPPKGQVMTEGTQAMQGKVVVG